ncbi:hypothetical protein C8F01DRAFT_1264022 [Mycena amicta]|nr:hypothetical protein C8F01DRAFT_1264022 [Mycena amicta]
MATLPTSLVSLIFIPGDPAVVENDGAEEHIMDDVPNANFLQSLPFDISPPSNLQPDRASRYGERHIPISYSCTAAYTPNLDLSGSGHQPVHITSRVTAWEAGPNESAVAYRPPSLPTCSSPISKTNTLCWSALASLLVVVVCLVCYLFLRFLQRWQDEPSSRLGLCILDVVMTPHLSDWEWPVASLCAQD